MSGEFFVGTRVQFSPLDVPALEDTEWGGQITGTINAIEWNMAGAIVELDEEWAHLSPDKPVRVKMDDLEVCDE